MQLRLNFDFSNSLNVQSLNKTAHMCHGIFNNYCRNNFQSILFSKIEIGLIVVDFGLLRDCFFHF